ncbi:hypothetical protein [Algibacter sp. L1A34]|uniref:hypothetical protein n=1 Tax=Algibacter sp. L1A34 TaxID=2686365 RepID=UPI0018EF2E32|nr:hypothetical protein [Algibacter sp. L1A34]
MKKLYKILVLLLITASTFAQAPERMSYQGVIRDSGDALVTNQVVGMQISILQSSASGTAVYAETQTPTTNANGLATLEIGTGNTIDDFTTINWENGPYFIKTEIDPEGGTNYTITGTSQLLSVPYALHAKTAENGITTVQSDEITANSLKVGYTEALVSANTDVAANTVKVGITSGQASEITANTAKVSYTDAAAVALNTAKVGYTEALVSANTDVAANTAKVGLPSQTGQSGKYLTTNGTSPSWSTVAGGSPAVRTISANTTLVNSDEIVIINGAFTATFPSAPTDGMKLILCTTTGAAEINGNGKSLYVALQEFPSLTFAGANSNFYMFIYSSSIGGWIGMY